MAQTRFKVEDGLLVRGQANITGNTVIGGTLALEANVVTGITANGTIAPTANNEYDLGTTNFRYRRVFANSATLSSTLEVTGQANLYGGAHLQANLSFNNNTHSFGNTTAMVAGSYSQNTFVYNTLRVAAASGDPYFVANSSSVLSGSNLSIVGSKLTLNSGAVGIIAANSTSFTISTNSGAPTTIHEFLTTSGIRVAKYLIYCKNNSTDAVQCSEVVVMFDVTTSDVYIGEYNVMHSGAAPFMSYSAYKDENDSLVRLTAYSTHANVDITMQIVTLV